MSSLSPFQSRLEPPQPYVAQQRGWIAFTGILVLGVILIAWRGYHQVEESRRLAGAEVSTIAARMEALAGRAIVATSGLAATVQAGAGQVPAFQASAAERIRANAGVSFFTLEPSGLVREVVPGRGNERLLGFNIMGDPVQQLQARQAVQTRGVAVAGPVRLPNDVRAVVFRAPIITRGRDGRETVWGYVAGGISVADLVGATGLQKMVQSGYNVALFRPPVQGQKAETLFSTGGQFSSSVQAEVKLPGTHLRLAAARQGSWLRMGPVLLDGLLVLAGAILAGLATRSMLLLNNSEKELARIKSDSVRDAESRKQTLEEYRLARESAASLQSELATARSTTDSALTKSRELQTQLEETRGSTEALAKQLREKSAELEQLRSALVQSQEVLKNKETQLGNQVRIASEAKTASEAQAKEARAAIFALNQRLEAVSKQASESAHSSAIRIAELEEGQRELQAQLLLARKAEARANDLASILEATRAEVRRVRQEYEELQVKATNQPEHEPQIVYSETDPVPEPEEDSTTGKNRGDSDAVVMPAAVTDPELEERDDRTAADVVVPASHSNEESVSGAAGEADPETKVTTVVANPGPQDPEPAVKAIRKKRRKNDDQMDLFGPMEPAHVVMQQDFLTAEKEAEPLVRSGLPDESHPNGGHETNGGTESEVIPGPPPPETYTEDVTVPAIEGLTLNAGNFGSDGDRRAFMKKLQRFSESQANAPEKIRDSIIKGEVLNAEKLALHLAEAAAEIGAPNVKEQANGVAEAIKDEDLDAVEERWASLERALKDLLTQIHLHLHRSEKAAPAKRLTPPPPVDLPELRSAVGLMTPLLVDGDPGAKDCLKDNKNTFRSCFSAEHYLEFEQAVRAGKFPPALELLRKAVRKHGISI